MSFNLWHSLVIFGVLFINGRVAIWTYHWNNQRNAKKFLQMVRIENPDSTIIYAAASSRDDLALRKIRRQFEKTRSSKIERNRR